MFSYIFIKYGKYVFIKYTIFHKYEYVFVKYVCPKGKYAHAYLDLKVLSNDLASN